jgi:hypothetical protein
MKAREITMIVGEKREEEEEVERKTLPRRHSCFL